MVTDRGAAEIALLQKLWYNETVEKSIAAEKEQKTDSLCYLFLIFLTGGLVGWIYEEVFYWVTEGMLRNRGILYGPWLPIYGVGRLSIYAMKPVKNQPVLLFLLCAAVSGIVEYIIGYAGLHFFGLRILDCRWFFLLIVRRTRRSTVFPFTMLFRSQSGGSQPGAERLVKKLHPPTVHNTCLFLLLLFLADCVLSALFRTPITY